MTWWTNPFRFGAPPLVLQPARYWEWIVLARPYSNTTADIAEIGLTLTPGGSNICLGGTATSAIDTPAQAIDNNSLSFWVPAHTDIPGASIRVDLGSPELPVEATIQPHSTLPQRTPTVYLLRQSDDGVTYRPVQVLEYAGPFTASGGVGITQAVALAQHDFSDVEANARGWRISAEVLEGGDRLNVAEVAFCPTFGGSAIAIQENRAFCSSNSTLVGADGNPQRAFDGSTASFTQGRFALPNHFGFVSPSPVGVMEEVQVAPAGGLSTEKMSEMSVGWTVDGVTWHTKKSFTGISGWSNGVHKSFDLR